MEWETTTDSAGGKASKCESRERSRETTLPAWSSRDQTVKQDEPGRRIELCRKALRGPVGLERCGDAKPQESHREPTQFTRRPIAETRRTGPMLGGTPIWMSEVQTNEGGVGTRRKTLTRSGRKVNHATSGMTAPTTLPGSRVNVVRVASKQLAAIGSSQSSEGDEREELMSNPVVSKDRKSVV